jgi:hypothetical protein
MRTPLLVVLLALTVPLGCSKKEPPPPPPAPAPTPPAPAAAASADPGGIKTAATPPPAKCPGDTQVDDACIKLPAGWKLTDTSRKPGDNASFGDGHNSNGSLSFQDPSRLAEWQKVDAYRLTQPQYRFESTGSTPGAKGKFYVWKESSYHKVASTVAGSKHVVLCSTAGQGTLPPEALAICESISVQ